MLDPKQKETGALSLLFGEFENSLIIPKLDAMITKKNISVYSFVTIW